MFNWTANSLEFAVDNDQDIKEGWGPGDENRLYLSRDATGMRNG